MTSRISILAAVLASALAFGASPALASLTGEVNAGKGVAARVDARTATCKNLSNTDFEHLGEYVMGRIVGSRSAHEAMDARMEAMMGSANADRMHQALGHRYAGCANTSTGYGMMSGSGMMGATGGWGAMTGSGYAWMRNGDWQHLTRAGWQRAGRYMMGNGWMTSAGGSGWSTGAVIALVLGALVLGGVTVFAVLRTPRWRGPSRPSSV